MAARNTDASDVQQLRAEVEAGGTEVSKTSPTQRSLALLRKQGYRVAITEHWNAFVKRRQDLFGFIDLLAIGETMLAIQTTSGTNVAARVTKILELDAAREWIDAGHRIIVHGWAKRGVRGEVKRWDCREVEIERSMFDEVDET
jgi:hypothetical protein